MSTVIFHLDMDAFFASIEIVKNPHLKGKPVIVAGSPDKRGVVSTCSYEARAYGVHSAMSAAEAKRLCPHGVFLEGSYSLYREYSDKIMEILASYTHKVQVVSVDEAYVDVSDLGHPKTLAREMKQKIYAETKLTCSVGIASNKLVAKIASSLAKPNGLYFIPHGKEESFIRTLPLNKIPGIGDKTEEALNRDGIKTVADLQDLEMDTLVNRYGARGYHLYLKAHGKSRSLVEWESHPPKSIGAEETFPKDLLDPELIKVEIETLVEKVHKRLLRHKMRTRCLTLKLRDSAFKTITRSHTILSHTNQQEVILGELLSLFNVTYSHQLPLRLVGVSLSHLTSGCWQPTFWDWQQQSPRGCT